MNPEDVGRILDEIGERIGPAGEYAWQITVRQVVIDSLLWGAAGIAFLIASVVVYAAIRRWGRWYREQPDYDPDNDPRYLDLGVAAFFALIWVPMLVFVGTQVLNPEYHAMTRLLERLVPR